MESERKRAKDAKRERPHYRRARRCREIRCGPGHIVPQEECSQCCNFQCLIFSSLYTLPSLSVPPSSLSLSRGIIYEVWARPQMRRQSDYGQDAGSERERERVLFYPHYYSVGDGAPIRIFAKGKLSRSLIYGWIPF